MVESRAGRELSPSIETGVPGLAALPRLGAGISYREAWGWELIRHRDRLGLVEVIADDVVGTAAVRELLALRDALPVLLHGIGLSLGSAEGLNRERVRHVARLIEEVQPPWFSEHIAFTRSGDVEIGHLTPMPFTREAVGVLARNVSSLRSAVPGVPLLLENIAYTIALPGEMDEAEFIRAVIEATGCGLLLDLENVHANALNHGYDPIAHLERLPLERVVEVHLAGGIQRDGVYVDTHSRAVPAESWELLDWLLRRAEVRAVVIERDEDLPPFEELLDEVERARRCLDQRSGPSPG